MSEELLTKALIGDDRQLKKKKTKVDDESLTTLSLLSSLIDKLIKHDECLSQYYASLVLIYNVTPLFVDERKRVDKLICILNELKIDYLIVKEADDCKLTSLFNEMIAIVNRLIDNKAHVYLHELTAFLSECQDNKDTEEIDRFVAKINRENCDFLSLAARFDEKAKEFEKEAEKKKIHAPCEDVVNAFFKGKLNDKKKKLACDKLKLCCGKEKKIPTPKPQQRNNCDVSCNKNNTSCVGNNTSCVADDTSCVDNCGGGGRAICNKKSGCGKGKGKNVNKILKNFMNSLVSGNGKKGKCCGNLFPKRRGRSTSSSLSTSSSSCSSSSFEDDISLSSLFNSSSNSSCSRERSFSSSSSSSSSSSCAKCVQKEKIFIFVNKDISLRLLLKLLNNGTLFWDNKERKFFVKDKKDLDKHSSFLNKKKGVKDMTSDDISILKNL
jgi:hypothetical protein